MGYASECDSNVVRLSMRLLHASGDSIRSATVEGSTRTRVTAYFGGREEEPIPAIEQPFEHSTKDIPEGDSG